VTRLIAACTATGRVVVTVYTRRCFAQRYAGGDVELLVLVDEAHETPSGPAARRILEHEHEVNKRPEYARLATLRFLQAHPSIGNDWDQRPNLSGFPCIHSHAPPSPSQVSSP
jgi:hypothetical protein